MDVARVETLDELVALRQGWEALHAEDPHATVFTSWSWLRGWLERGPAGWLILVVHRRGGDRPIALLPLRGVQASGSQGQATTLAMAGWPAADYTGFFCAPGHEERALAALAGYLSDQPTWDRLDLRDVDDPRLRPWLSCFDPARFTTRCAVGEICPRIALPSSWDAYLRHSLGPRRRESLRRKMRQLEQVPGYRVEDAVDDDVASAVRRVVESWQRRWQTAAPEELEGYVAALERCAERDQLWLRTLWSGERPLAVMAAFHDRPRDAFRYYLSGFDPAFGRFSPGTVLVGQAIRHSIAEGYRIFDFMRGDEAYKYDFGAERHRTLNATVERRVAGQEG